MNKHTFVIIIIFLLIAVTSISIPASAQTQESKSKINATIITINPSNIKDVLIAVHNTTSPDYVKLSEDQIKDALRIYLDGPYLTASFTRHSHLQIFPHYLNLCME
jgi:hypothetical protein